MNASFSDVLAGFQGAAAKTKLDVGGGLRPAPGEYHLQLISVATEAKTNQYGPFVQSKLKFGIMDPGDLQGQEFTVVYLINLDKEGKLNYGGQNFVFLAGILAGEPIEGNDPLMSSSIIEAACTANAVIHARVFQTKKDFNGINPMSLETPIEATTTA